MLRLPWPEFTPSDYLQAVVATASILVAAGVAIAVPLLTNWQRKRMLQTGVYYAALEAAMWIAATAEASRNPAREEIARRIAERRGYRTHLEHAGQCLHGFSAEALAEIGLLPHVVRLKQNLAVALAAVGNDTFEALKEGEQELIVSAERAWAAFRAVAEVVGTPTPDEQKLVTNLFDTE